MCSILTDFYINYLQFVNLIDFYSYKGIQTIQKIVVKNILVLFKTHSSLRMSNSNWPQSYASQVLYKHLKEAAQHSHLGRKKWAGFWQISLYVLQTKPKLLNNIVIQILILNFQFNLKCMFAQKSYKVTEMTHDLTFYSIMAARR